MTSPRPLPANSAPQDEPSIPRGTPESVREIAGVIRRFRLDYGAFAKACHAARVLMGLRPKRGGRKLPKLLPEASLRAFFEAVARGGNVQHELMMRLLLDSGARVAEFCAIRMSDVDVESRKVFISQGKGGRDRYVLFSDALRLPLKAHMHEHQEQEYLFESRHRRPYTPRRVRQIMDDYAEAAGIENIHPHLMRHATLTALAKDGISAAKIQLLSGHQSPETLKIYTHLSLGDVSEEYQQTMRKRQL